MKKIEIIPAILPKDFSEVEEKIDLVKGFAKTVQIDICDGQFVPNATWPYRKHDDSFHKIIGQEVGFPGWKDVNFEVDLMANKPEELVGDWVSAGASRIIVHANSLSADRSPDGPERAIKFLGGKVEIGLALEVDTSIELIEPVRDMIQFIQCMGIGHIGFQGQDFDSRVIENVKKIKKLYPELPVSVDGGINLENAPELIAAGAERLVVGSAIFGSDNPIEAIQKFWRIAGRGWR